MDELILVDKPLGWSSFRVVKWVKRYFGVAKAGHAGTLDPLATGLVLVATGRRTRDIAHLQAQRKEYYALILLGFRTASDDAEYPPEPVGNPTFLSVAKRQSLLKSFTGRIEQRPPAFSALKVSGKRAYRLARQGMTVELKPRLVDVFAIDEIRYEPPHRWLLRIECGKGVYIRSLARDIGEATGWGAYLGALRRTRIGNYTVQRAIQPDGHLLR